MDELARNSKIPYPYEISEIDVAVNGRKDDVFTWGGLMIHRVKGNRSSDGTLNHEESAEAVVPECMFRMKIREGPNTVCQISVF